MVNRLISAQAVALIATSPGGVVLGLPRTRQRSSYNLSIIVNLPGLLGLGLWREGVFFHCVAHSMERSSLFNGRWLCQTVATHNSDFLCGWVRVSHKHDFACARNLDDVLCCKDSCVTYREFCRMSPSGCIGSCRRSKLCPVTADLRLPPVELGRVHRLFPCPHHYYCKWRCIRHIPCNLPINRNISTLLV